MTKQQDIATHCQDDAYAPIPDPDSTLAYLSFAHEDIQQAITHLALATDDSRVDASLRAALDALRDAQTAVEAELEARRAEA